MRNEKSNVADSESVDYFSNTPERVGMSFHLPDLDPSLSPDGRLTLQVPYLDLSHAIDSRVINQICAAANIPRQDVERALDAFYNELSALQVARLLIERRT